MKWTTKKPRKPGWWWYREKARNGIWNNQCVMQVYNKCVSNGIERYTHRGNVSFSTGEWSDEPIPEPEG